ncbi:AraC family transcriptional regulator [Intrasporangium sp. YIM S08009]|uniref:helix-turn-helix transcriptional regulator n=1 Tax=Intrasporangium zincisolvens TaxID=3080018 RepID=UPI002B054C4A|nr:AraC family transcriptional regulator [Intrasporangium sp. YIM S08009]
MTAATGRLGEVLVAGRILGGGGLPAGTTRRHPTWGLTFVTAGSGRYRDAAHDEPVAAGTLILVHPGHPHWYGADARGWDEHFVVFDGVAYELAARRGALTPGRPLVHDLPVRRWAARFASFERPRPATVAARDAQAVDLLAALLDALAVDEQRRRRGPGATDAWLARSVELLGHDLGEPLDLHDVAAAVGEPYETWRRRFRVETGTSPYAHRAARRLASATELLVHTGLGVRDIAAATGYTDERHLIRRFRAATGLTPRAFRDASR